MGVGQIIKIVGVLVAVVAGLMGGFSQSAMVIAVLGAVGGYFIADEDATRFLVATVALTMIGGALNSIPVVGPYITSGLGGLSALFSAGAVTVIVVRIVKSLMP